jgi:hypothetical protein
MQVPYIYTCGKCAVAGDNNSISFLLSDGTNLFANLDIGATIDKEHLAPIGGTSFGTVPSGWTLAYVADFNGDGKADFLWRNAATGQMYMWFMNGSASAPPAPFDC